MSITALPPASSNGHDRRPDGVRTYRGGSLAELIPQIREELGPDAIILREREGLIGGVSGFFAKRCVEVDARAATQRIDVYDDEDDMSAAERMAEAERRADATLRAQEILAARRRKTEAARIADALREARTADTAEPIDEPVQQPRAQLDTVIAEQKSFANQLLAAGSTPDVEVALSKPRVAPAPKAKALPRPAAERAAVPEPAKTPKPVKAPALRPAAPARAATAPAVKAPAAAPAVKAPAATPAAKAPAPATPAVKAPAPATPAVKAPAEAPAPVAATPAPAKRLRAGRLLQLPGQRAKRSRQAREVAEAGRELTGHGLDTVSAARLVSDAAAHAAPFAGQGGLREAARRAVARSLPRPATPPASGAAIAIVGAGGAGKTRTAAALAAAYGRASSLSVTAVSLGDDDRGRALKSLLKPERVSVKFAANASKAVAQKMRNRTGEMIVIDTAAVAPSDQSAVRALAAELEPLALDAIYVAVPATLGAQAARQLLEGLAPLAPTGIVITHADETDQLGVAVQLSTASGVPVAYVHEGLDVNNALTAPDPFELAKRVMP